MIELYINNKKVDLDEEIDFSFTYESINTQQPDAIKNTFSKTISLKGTNNNNDIFNHYYKLDRFGNDVFDAKKRIPFELLNNGEMVESGYLSLDSINYKQGQIIYNVTLYGGLGDFFYTLAYDEEGEEKKLSDLYFGFSNGNYSTDEPISKENETDRRVLFDLNKEYLTESWQRVISKRNTKKYSKRFKSLGLQDNIVPIPTYSGFYDDFDCNKALIDTTTIRDGRNAYIINSALDSESETFGNKWYIAEATRDLDEWEIGDLRANKQRLGIKLSAVFDAISNPLNNGGYNIKWDDTILNSTHYNDGYVVIPRFEKNNIIELGGNKIQFDLNKLTKNISIAETDNHNGVKATAPINLSDYTLLNTIYEVDTNKFNVNFSFYPQVKCDNISNVLNDANYNYHNVTNNVSFNTFFSFGRRNVDLNGGEYERYYYNELEQGTNIPYQGNHLEELPLMIYGGICYEFAVKVNFDNGDNKIFYSNNNVFTTNDINKRFTAAETLFVNKKYLQVNNNRIAVGYDLENEIDDTVANIMLSNIKNRQVNINNVNFYTGELDIENKSLVQQGIITSKDSIFISIPIDIDENIKINSIEIYGWCDYINSGECTRAMNVTTQPSLDSESDWNFDVIPDGYLSGYWNEVYPTKNGQQYLRTPIKTWNERNNYVTLSNYIDKDYWYYNNSRDGNTYKRQVPLIEFPLSNIISNTKEDTNNISEGKITKYFDEVSVTKKMLFNTLPSPYRFLLDYIKLLNYRVEKDPYSKTIYIKENNSYYIDEIINVDESIDYSKDIKILPTNINNKYIEFSVNAPETYASKLYKSKYDNEFNVLKFDTLYEHNNETKRLFEDSEITTTLPYNISSILNNQVNMVLPVLLSPTVNIISDVIEEGAHKKIENVTYGYSSVYERLNNVKDINFKMCCFDSENKEVKSLTDMLVFFNYAVPTKANSIVSDTTDDMFIYNENECYVQGETVNMMHPTIMAQHSFDSLFMFYDNNGTVSRKVYNAGDTLNYIYKESNYFNDNSVFRIYFYNGVKKYLYADANGVFKTSTNLQEGDGWFWYDKYGYLRYDTDYYVKYDILTNGLIAYESNLILQQIKEFDDYDIFFDDRYTYMDNEVAEPLNEYPLFLPYKVIKEDLYNLNVGEQFYFNMFNKEYINKDIKDFNNIKKDIFNDKWKDEFDILYNKNSITVECSVLLVGKPNELLKKKFFFNNCLWRLIKIDGYSINQQRPFKCKFIRL